MVTDDFFRARLDQMIDLGIPLAVLAGCRGDRSKRHRPTFAEQVTPGSDLFGTTLESPVLVSVPPADRASG